MLRGFSNFEQMFRAKMAKVRIFFVKNLKLFPTFVATTRFIVFNKMLGDPTFITDYQRWPPKK